MSSKDRSKKPSERRGRDKIPPPPANRIPENVGGQGYYEIESLHVNSWNPLPDGKGPSTQVHVSVHVKQLPYPLVMRFKGPNTLGTLIESLERHRNDVWPAGDVGPESGRVPEYTIQSDATSPAETMWETFEAASLAPDAGADQRQAMREAYHAGMIGLLAVFKTIGEDAVSEDEGAEFLSRIEAELMKGRRS